MKILKYECENVDLTLNVIFINTLMLIFRLKYVKNIQPKSIHLIKYVSNKFKYRNAIL